MYIVVEPECERWVVDRQYDFESKVPTIKFLLLQYFQKLHYFYIEHDIWYSELFQKIWCASFIIINKLSFLYRNIGYNYVNTVT